jgi:hypothetical protein
LQRFEVEQLLLALLFIFEMHRILLYQYLMANFIRIPLLRQTLK